MVKVELAVRHMFTEEFVFCVDMFEFGRKSRIE